MNKTWIERMERARETGKFSPDDFSEINNVLAEADDLRKTAGLMERVHCGMNHLSELLLELATDVAGRDTFHGYQRASDIASLQEKIQSASKDIVNRLTNQKPVCIRWSDRLDRAKKSRGFSEEDIRALSELFIIIRSAQSESYPEGRDLFTSLCCAIGARDTDYVEELLLSLKKWADQYKVPKMKEVLG